MKTVTGTGSREVEEAPDVPEIQGDPESRDGTLADPEVPYSTRTL